MNGQRDKKGQKLTKSEGRSNDVTFWSLSGGRWAPSSPLCMHGRPARLWPCTV